MSDNYILPKADLYLQGPPIETTTGLQCTSPNCNRHTITGDNTFIVENKQGRTALCGKDAQRITFYLE